MCGHHGSQRWLCWSEQEAQGKGGVRLFAQSGGGGSGFGENNRNKVLVLFLEKVEQVNIMERSCWTGCLFRLLH